MSVKCESPANAAGLVSSNSITVRETGGANLGPVINYEAALRVRLGANTESLLTIAFEVLICSICVRLYLARRNRRRKLNTVTLLEPHRSWWRRPWVISLVCALTFVCGLLSFIQANFRRLPLVQDTKQSMETSDVVRSKIGSPVKLGWMINGSATEKQDAGRANLWIPVSGSRSDGNVYVSGTKANGTWVVDKMFLIVDGDPTKYSLTAAKPEQINKP